MIWNKLLERCLCKVNSLKSFICLMQEQSATPRLFYGSHLCNQQLQFYFLNEPLLECLA